MKFSVHIDGADTGLIERLTAAANRKLAPKLKRLAARHVRHAQASSHHALVRHPITGHAVTHRTKARRSAPLHAAHTATSSIAPGGIFGSSAASAPPDTSAAGPAPLDASPGTTTGFAPASSLDDTAVFDVTLDPVLL